MKESRKLSELRHATEENLLGRIDIVKEARSVLDNDYYEEIAHKYGTDSAYMPPDLMVSIDKHVENILNSIPSLRFGGTKKHTAEVSSNINKQLRSIIRNNDLDYKISMLATRGFRSGIGVGEVIYKEKISQGLMWKDGKKVAYNHNLGGTIDLNVYDVLDNEVLIDPLANPSNIKDTASYVVVKFAEYHKDDFKKIADENDWSVDMEKIEEMLPYYWAQRSQESKGIIKPEHVVVHKIFYKDGTVDTFVNEIFLIEEGVLNNKMIAEMPLIFFIPKIAPNHCYGRLMWEDMKYSLELKAGIINLMLDNATRNVTAPIVTSDDILAKELENQSQEGGRVVSFSGVANEDVKKVFAVPQWPDMTNGSNMLFNLASADVQKISGISDISLGIQEKQIRVKDAAGIMHQNTVASQSSLIKQIEFTLLAPMADHLLKIMHNFYESFEDITVDRELLNVKSVRVKNGSTLLEDSLTRVETLRSLLGVASNPALMNDFSLVNIIIDLFEEMGLPEIEKFLLNPEVATMKSMLQMGLSQEEAAAFTQQAQVIAQKRQQQVAAEAQGGQ